MKTKIITPEREEKKRPDCPYLAVHKSVGEIYTITDVVVVYIGIGGIYAQRVTGSYSNLLNLADELDFIPLPSGTEIRLVQE